MQRLLIFPEELQTAPYNSVPGQEADRCCLPTWRQVGFVDLWQPAIFENSELVSENSRGFRTASAFLSAQQ